MSPVVRTFEDYAKVDFAIGDNDPVYFAIEASRREYGHDWSTRFCVAMLAYYDMGVASVAADYEGKEFWDHLWRIYLTAPRGNMRRHFRGDNGKRTLQSMTDSSPNPNDFFLQVPLTYTGLREYCVSNLYGFGPMFQLKMCDYMDRCLDIPVKDMYMLAYLLPTNPEKAVKALYPGESVPAAFKKICERIDRLNLLAPPMYDRPVGPAEVETALCDWKTAKFGSNWLGADLVAKRDTLMGYGEKAEWMAKNLPPLVKIGTFKLELV